MSRLRGLRQSARAESGVVLVIVAVSLPAFIGVLGLALDVGNWYAHKRHLQTQADAGALAGAGKFRFPCSNDPIEEEVAKYSSVGSGDVSYNPQIGDTPPAELHREMNSETWHAQDEPIDDTVRTGLPCAAMMVDVKLTETNLPWWLRALQVPFINTHARVEILQQTSAKGALPVGVPDNGPKKVRALFVNEAAGTVIASADLIPTGVTAGGLTTWSNISAPVSVNVNTAKVGVRIVVSATDSTTCGEPLVLCYGAGTSAAIVANDPGLSLIRGYLATPVGTAAAPKVHDAVLTSNGGSNACTEDTYFTATVSAATCSVGIRAHITGPAAGAEVWAKPTSGNNGTKVALTHQGGGIWSAPTGLNIATGTGAVPMDIGFGNGGGAPVIEAQAVRAYAGNENVTNSGPIKMVRVFENSVAGANSFLRGTSHDLAVTVGLKPNLENAQSVNDTPVVLKVAATGGSASQNQALDCTETLSNLEDELTQGCDAHYIRNTGQACPTGNWRPSTEQPWNCVVINTGVSGGQVTHGLNMRFLGDRTNPSCTNPNNWADFPDFNAGDPRIIQVFLTPFGAFTGTGGATVPVTGFATFYVTGWDAGGCQGAGDDTAGNGEIVGHFIKYIDTIDPGTGEGVCDADAFGACVAVFTR